ncbi:MAG TPA: glycosyltransferase family 39 protein [Chthoniobacterales bacterium]|nr:glycosyltransferase family 39 protein [Chthoniobacterales bacterium]
MFPSDFVDAILGSPLKSINYALFFLGCIVFHSIGTWSLPLIDRDEPRFAEASREMIERGDYVVPYFNNQLRLDKPPFAYWAQVTSYRFFGENDFAARLPSAIAAALVALTIFIWGSRLPVASASQATIGDNRVGFWAAVIFTLSLQTFLHAKAAVADMWLILFVTIAHWSGFELLRSSINQASKLKDRTFVWWFSFYLALALGFLAKGPIAWTPLLTVAAIKVFIPEPHLTRRFKFVRGILLMIAIVSLWGVPALIRTHGEFFAIGIGRHVIGRSFGAMEGHGSNSLGIYLLLVPFYFVTVFASFFPWSIKLPELVRRIRQNRDETDDYLILGAAIVFVIFSLVKTKLPHYTLPAFPLIALLVARHCCGNGQFFKRCAVVAVCAYFTIALVVPLFVAKFFPAHELFTRSHDYLRPEMEFGAVDYQEPSLVWYFRSRAHGFFTPLNRKNATDFMSGTGPRFIIVPTQLAGEILRDPESTWKTFSTNGFNVAKGRQVDLTLVLKPE